MNRYNQANIYLKKLLLQKVLDKSKTTGGEQSLIKNFYKLLKSRFGFNTIKDQSSFLQILDKYWQSSLSKPKEIKLNDDFLMQFIVDNHIFLKNIKPKLLKDYGCYLLSRSNLLEEFFIQYGLSSAYIINKFNFNIEKPSFISTPVRSSVDSGRKLFSMIISKVLISSIFIGFSFKKIYSDTLKKFSATNLLGKSAMLLGAAVIVGGTIFYTIDSTSNIFNSDKGQTVITKTFKKIAEYKLNESKNNLTYSPKRRTSLKQKYLFKWNINSKDSLNLIKKGSVKVYVNEQPLETFSEYNIVNFVCLKNKNETAYFSGIFKTFNYSKDLSVPLLTSKSRASFSIKQNGIYSVPEKQKLPNIRSVPSFPNREISVGESWQAPFTLNFFDMTPPIVINDRADYRYLSNIIIKQNNYAVIRINYAFLEQIELEENAPPMSTLFIGGSNYTLLLWDLDNMIPFKMKETYDEIIRRKSGDTVRTVMRFKSYYDITRPLGKRRLVNLKNKINKSLKNYANISTVISLAGVHIRFGKAYFNFDDFFINQQCKMVLDKIAPILKQYGEYEIVLKEYGKESSAGKSTFSLAKYLNNTPENRIKKMYGDSENRVNIDVTETANFRLEMIIKESGN